MSAAAIVTVTASLCAFSVTALLLAGMVLGGNWGARVHRWFFAMLLCNSVGACLEALAAFLIGRPGGAAAALFRVVDFADYACGSLVGIAFSLYLYEYLSTKTRVSKAPFVLMAALNGANIPLVAVGQLARWFIWLDASNQFHSRNIVWLTQLLPLLSMAVVVFVTWQNRKALQAVEWASLLFYTAAPAVCYAIEYAYNAHPLWISYFGAAIAMLMVYVNIQVELGQRMRKQELELADSRVAIMLSQIKPHFLYNSLTAIGEMCATNPAGAGAAVTEFGHYLRGNLESLEKNRVAFFEDELNHVEAYLAMEQLRFKDRLRVEYDITVRDFVLPPLTVQPLVENAVRHGLMEKKEGGTLRIGAQTAGRSIQVTVEDDGVGFEPAAIKQDGHTHVGIENVRGRLAALCGGTLCIESAPGSGTKAIITIPYREDAL